MGDRFYDPSDEGLDDDDDYVSCEICHCLIDPENTEAHEEWHRRTGTNVN